MFNNFSENEYLGDNFPNMENKEEIQDLLIQDHIRDLLNRFGDFETWQKIEQITDAQQRGYYRKIFFMMGGKLC